MLYQELLSLTNGKATYEQFVEIEAAYMVKESMTKKQAAALWKRRFGEKTRKPARKRTDETRYIVTDVVSIPVTRVVKKGTAYRDTTKPGWGVVEWFSPADGYKNPVFRDRSDKTQVMYGMDDTSAVMYGKDGSEFMISDSEEINLKDAPAQADTAAIIVSDSCGFWFWADGERVSPPSD